MTGGASARSHCCERSHIIGAERRNGSALSTPAAAKEISMDVAAAFVLSEAFSCLKINPQKEVTDSSNPQQVVLLSSALVVASRRKVM